MLRAHTIGAVLVAASFGCATDAVDDTGSTEQLSSVHLKGGAHAEPSFTDLGLQLESVGDLSGLGNADVHIMLTAHANPTATCGNPGSNTWQAPGQNPAPYELTGVEDIPADEIKNGNVTFDVKTEAISPQVADAPDCPNSSWTEIITDLSFTDATIEVEQPTGTLVLTVSCTFTPSTSNGAVSGGTVSCSSS